MTLSFRVNESTFKTPEEKANLAGLKDYCAEFWWLNPRTPILVAGENGDCWIYIGSGENVVHLQYLTKSHALRPLGFLANRMKKAMSHYNWPEAETV